MPSWTVWESHTDITRMTNPANDNTTVHYMETLNALGKLGSLYREYGEEEAEAALMTQRAQELIEKTFADLGTKVDQWYAAYDLVLDALADEYSSLDEDEEDAFAAITGIIVGAQSTLPEGLR